MKHFTNESEISSNGSKPSAWKRLKGPLDKTFLTLIILAFLFILILSIKSTGNKNDQKISEDFKNDLVDKGSMSDSILLPEVGEIANGNNETTLTPEEKATPDEEKPPVIASQENKEDNPAEKVVENNPKTVPAVKNETVKKTTTVKMPATPPTKEKSKAISCKHKNDKPSYSKTKGKHMDEDCCADPDEWSKPGCVYSQKGLDLMLKGKSSKK